MSLKIKIITGFRADQQFSINEEETHKAYYLFMHPEQRGIFNNGRAVIGKNIKEIVPDYHGTMEWNPTHTLDSDDWNEIRAKGVDRKLRDLMHDAKKVATTIKPEMMNLPMSEARQKLLT